MPEAQDEQPAAVPIDLEAASLDDEDDERDVDAGVLHYGRRRRVGRVLAVLVSLGLVCWTLELAASWRLEEAAWSLRQCMRDHGFGELQKRCRTPWLLLPSVWPTTRSDALELRADLAYEIDELRLSRATRVDFDPATAELALAGMLDNEQALAQRYGVIDNLQDQGAHSAVLARAEADEQLEYYERVNASHSGLLLGEPDRLIELIADTYELEFRFAGTTYGPAWLCLRDPERGAAAMLQVAASPTDAHAQNMSRIALLACGGPETDASVLERERLGEPTSPAADAWLAAREADHGRRSAAKWLDANTNNTARAQVIAMAMRDEAASIERLATWLAPSPDPRASDVLGFGHDLHRAGRGMIVSHRHDAAITYDPATMAAAAAQLAMLAEIAAPEVEPSKSPEDDDEPLSTAEVLRRGAAVLADEAALEWLARGRSDEALRLARRARPWHRAEHEHIAVGLGLLAGDYEGTLAWIEARRAAQPEGHATVSALILDELELRALAGLGRWHEAHARALERHADDHDRAGLLCGHELVMQTWLLALSIQVAEQPSELVLAQQLGTRACPWQSEELAQLAHLLANPDVARPTRLRGLHMPISSDYPDLVVRAIGAVAHAPAHEERWLDAEIQFEDKLGRELLWARAEAARWRGDVEAEQRWRQRLARLLALGDSEDRALLLHAAGL